MFDDFLFWESEVLAEIFIDGIVLVVGQGLMIGGGLSLRLHLILLEVRAEVGDVIFSHGRDQVESTFWVEVD